MRKRVYLIDGHSQAYRAIFSSGPNLSGPNGEPTKGPYFFAMMLMKLVREHQPTHLGVVWENSRRDLERRKMYPGYKAARDQRADDPMIRMQLSRIRQIVNALGIPVLIASGWEADDLIASIVEKYRLLQTVVSVVIVSRDKDLHQCISDTVSMYDPQSETRTGVMDVMERWGVAPRLVADVMTLSGDSTDGVPGVKGIGIKRASELIQTYGSVEDVLENEEDLSPSIQDALAVTDLKLMRKLVTLRTDLPVPKLSDLKFRGLDRDGARDLFARLGFRRWQEKP